MSFLVLAALAGPEVLRMTCDRDFADDGSSPSARQSRAVFEVDVTDERLRSEDAAG